MTVSITTQPTEQVVLSGDATFTVEATGNGTLTYQWYDHLDAAISGATSSTLTISSPDEDDNLNGYYCRVTDDDNSEDTDEVLLHYSYDEYFPDVRFCFNARKWDDGATVLDSSVMGRAITQKGTTSIVDGVLESDNGLRVPSNDYYIAELRGRYWMDWTYEIRFRMDTYTHNAMLLDLRDGTAIAGMVLYVNSNNLRFLLGDGSSWFVNQVGSSTLTTGVDYEVALQREGTTYSVYLNGVLEFSFDSYKNASDTEDRFHFGGGNNGSDELEGKIYSIRYTGNYARYSGSYTAYPTAMFPEKGPEQVSAHDDPYIDYVTMLFDFEDNEANDKNPYDSTFRTHSSSSIDTGGQKVIDTDAKWGTNSWDSPGGSYGRFWQQNELNLVNQPTGPYTLEFWVKFDTISASRGLFSSGNNTNNDRFQIVLRSDSKLEVFVAKDGTTIGQFASTATLSTGTWYYIALTHDDKYIECRYGTSGATSQLFSGTLSDYFELDHSTSFQTRICNARVGSTHADMDGKLDSFRRTNVVRDISTVPTAAFPRPTPADMPYLQLQPNGDPYWGVETTSLQQFDATAGSTSWTDAASGQTWNRSGNAVQQSTPTKFGAGSGYTDGSSDRIYSPTSNPDYQMGTGDFCIEGWFKPINGGNGQNYGRIMLIGPNGGNGSMYYVHATTSDPMQALFQFYSGGYLNRPGAIGGTLCDNQWHNVVLQRSHSGKVYTFWYDGVRVSRRVYNAIDNYNASATVHLGANSSNGEAWRGNFESWRFTKGTARYDGNKAIQMPTSLYPESTPVPEIDTQPSSTSVEDDQEASFTVVASGTGTLSYQWYDASDDSTISGATSATYTIAEVDYDTQNGLQVYCIVTDDFDTVQSNTVTLTVTKIAFSITSHPSNETVTEGEFAVFEVTASGGTPLTYQWYEAPSTLISGETGSTYTVQGVLGDDGTEVFCRVTDKYGDSLDSNNATLNVNEDNGGELPDPIGYVGGFPGGFAKRVGQAVNINVQGYFESDFEPHTFALQSGTLPTGLSVTSGGYIYGEPTTVQSQSGLVIRATDNDGNTADTPSFTFVIDDPVDNTRSESRVDAKRAALVALGYTGTLPDMTLQWLQANGATSDILPEAWQEMVISKGYGYPYSTQSAWKLVLQDEGYSGTLDEMDRQFWIDGGTFS